MLNDVLIRSILKKTPYELWKDRKTSINYFCIFGCKCFILNNEKDNTEKIDVKSDEDIFLRYFTSSKAYKVFNKRTLIIEECIYIVFDESNDKSPRKEDVLDEDAEILTNKMDNLKIKNDPPQNEEEDLKKDDEEEEKIKEPTISQKDELFKEWRYVHGHSKDLIIGDPSQKVRTHFFLENVSNYLAFVS